MVTFLKIALIIFNFFVYTRPVITPEFFGSDLTVNDTRAFKLAVDSAIKVNGIIYLEKTYIVDSINLSNNGKNFSIKIVGNYQWGGVRASVIRSNRKEGYLLNVQKGKGVVIEGIYFEGNYTVPKQSLFLPYENYGDSTCSDYRYGPYVAIAVDWYRNNTVSGSTATTIRDCLFANFTGGIIYSPNGFTLNNELNTIERVVFQNLKFGFAGCQAQEKVNTIDKVKAWGNIHTVFVFNKYGQQHPGNYRISNVSIAGGVGNLVYRKSLGFFQLVIDFVFGEMLYAIGEWDGGNKKDALYNFDCNFYSPVYAGAFPSTHFRGNGVTFYNCDFRYYGNFNYPLLFAGNNTYINSDPLGRYLPIMKGMYNTSTDTTYKIIPVTRSGIFVADDRTAYLFNSFLNTGDNVVITELRNNAWVGQAEVESNSGKAVKLKFISYSVESNKTYQIGKYEKSNSNSITNVNQ